MQIISRAEAKDAGYKRYFTGKPCLRGHTVERQVSSKSCLTCLREKMAESYSKDPVKHREIHRKWRETNLESARAASRDRARARRKNTPDQVRAAQRAHYALNADSISLAARQRRRDDPIYAFTQRARALVRKAFSRGGFKKGSRTESVLGCSFAEFRAQVERQFLPGMGWHNMHLWEIDHIVPASSAKSKEDVEALNRAGNLRPLWRCDNRSKGDSVLFLL